MFNNKQTQPWINSQGRKSLQFQLIVGDHAEQNLATYLTVDGALEQSKRVITLSAEHQKN